MGKIVHLHVDGTKLCSRCGERKPSAQFHVRPDTKSGFASACIDCHRKWDRKRYREQTERRKASAKWAQMKFQHGLEKPQWQAIMQTQNFRCAICNSVFALGKASAFNPCIDHDHASGRVKVRAALPSVQPGARTVQG